MVVCNLTGSDAEIICNIICNRAWNHQPACSEILLFSDTGRLTWMRLSDAISSPVRMELEPILNCSQEWASPTAATSRNRLALALIEVAATIKHLISMGWFKTELHWACFHDELCVIADHQPTSDCRQLVQCPFSACECANMRGQALESPAWSWLT